MTPYTNKHAYVHIARVFKDLKYLSDTEYQKISSPFIHFETTGD